MKIIKNYNQFNESSNNDEDDISFVISELVKNARSSKEVFELTELIKKLEVNESVNEGLFDKFRGWLDDKLFKYLINRKKTFYTKLLDKLNIFDLSTIDDVFESYPSFTDLKSMYLAGGMDEAADAGKGWREKLENEFGEGHIIESDDLEILLKNPKILSEFDQPALLNPVRKEVDRNVTDEFSKSVSKLKSKDYDPRKDGEEPLDFFRKTFSKTIEPEDEHLLRISDAVFLGQDKAAGAGTYGELQLLSMIRKPLFCWLVNKSENVMGDIKLWSIPHLSKVMLNEEDMKTFVKTLKTY